MKAHRASSNHQFLWCFSLPRQVARSSPVITHITQVLYEENPEKSLPLGPNFASGNDKIQTIDLMAFSQTP